jgi:hypothetical protein
MVQDETFVCLCVYACVFATSCSSRGHTSAHVLLGLDAGQGRTRMVVSSQPASCLEQQSSHGKRERHHLT